MAVLAAGCAGPTPERVITRLDPEEATRLADSIRQAVPVDVAEGLTLSLWAPERLVADPIALSIDDKGHAYVTRTNRQKNSEFDIRGHRDWMLRSISFRTVEDRRAFLREEFAPERSSDNDWLADLNGDGSRDWRDLAVEKEHVYRIEDSSGDGLADFSQLFVDDFHTEVTDVAGGVLVHGDDVYLGVAPDLWRMRDTRGDGMVDVKESISHGYAVHIGFGGHGMSGLTLGPDGRIYWSIGDIGLNVVDRDGTTWAYPNQGAILRSEPDGSGFEVFAAGLRNTHEFVFDEYGNLISVDNDGDHPGEMERIVYIVNGSDSGWRINWQFGKYTDPDNNGYKVWMDEGLFRPRFEGQAAYITPPIASYHSGPAGMAYEPGTALDGRWRGRFFVAEFTGSPARSRILAFLLRPKGASFDFVDEIEVTRGILATGLDFGPDGALYVADWLEGWATKDKGRIWKLDVPEAAATDARAGTRSLLGEGFTGRAADELGVLLRHDDMRIRTRAQHELAGRGDAEVLLAAARQSEHQLARLHGLWGITQIARRQPNAAEPLASFLSDSDEEVRAQAAKMIGDVRYAPAADMLIPLLSDEAARARFFAAEALGRIGHRPAVEPIITMLEANDDEDAHLRHAGALALARIGDAEPVVALADHPSRAVRIAAVVALRRMRDAGIARFLEDEDEYIVTEAARAINDDEGIEGALPALARVLREERFTNEPLLRRAVSANLRLGSPESAQDLAAFAARGSAPEAIRSDAIGALGVWPKPSVVDRVDGTYRGEIARDAAPARSALADVVEPLLGSGSAEIRVAAVGAVRRLRYESAAPALANLLRRDPSPDVRAAALEALHDTGYERLEEAIGVALEDADRDVRMKALELVPELDLPQERIVELLASVLEGEGVLERQTALEVLGGLGSDPAREVLAGQLEALESGSLDREVELDVIEAVERGGGDELNARLATYRTGRDDYSEVLFGGAADRGRRVYFQHPAAQCARCHVIGNFGGDVGPPLTDVGIRLGRDELLEALVAPSARIAPGYGTVALTLSSGETIRGTLREESPGFFVVDVGDGEVRRIPREEVANRQNGPSAMPPMGTVLNRRELRDVVAFLVELRGLPPQ